MPALAVLVVLLSMPTTILADPGDRCTRAKLLAAARYTRAYYDCYVAAASAGLDPAPACLFAAADRGRAGLAAADGRGPCPGTPDAVVNALCVPFIPAGDPACRAAKLRAAGSRSRQRLRCHAAALRRGGSPPPRCLARAEARFAERFARAETLGACGGDAANVEAIVDGCAVAMVQALSCGNGRLDYGELCEGAARFCAPASCRVMGGACCVTGSGCFQFGGPLEACFLPGGVDVRPGFCTTAGCIDDVPITPTPVCCQLPGAACTQHAAASALELRSLAATCGAGAAAVVGACGDDGRCIAASVGPAEASTTSTTTSTTTSISSPGGTTTTLPVPICLDLGAPCGGCGNGACVQPLAGIPLGACVVPIPIGPCAATDPACGPNEICLAGSPPAQCHTLCQ